MIARYGYWLAALLIGCSIATGVVVGARVVDRIRDLDDALPQVLGPGDARVRVGTPGRQTIFLETRTTYRGRTYSTGDVSGLQIVVHDPAGRSVRVRSASSNTTYDVGGRSGRSIAAFSAPRAGSYDVETTADTDTRFVLAIGRLDVLSLVGLILGGVAIAGFTFLAGVTLIVLTIMDRRKRGSAAPTIGPLTTLGALTTTIAIGVALLMATVATASPLALDASFSGDGIVRTRHVDATAVAVDGALLLAEIQCGEHRCDGVVERRLASGVRDTGFGTEGMYALPSNLSMQRPLLAERNGAIAIAEITFDPTNALLTVIRLDATGTPATEFSGDGVFTIDAVRAREGGGPDDWPTALALCPDGSTIVATDRNRGATGIVDGLIVKIRGDGQLDTLWGDATRPGRVLRERVTTTALACDADGRVVSAEYEPRGRNADGIARVSRLTSAGAIDTTFGTSGSTRLVRSFHSIATEIDPTSGGQWLVSGSLRRASAPRGGIGFVTRLSPSGALDPTFGSGGTLTLSLTPVVLDRLSVLERPDGSLLLGGNAYLTGDSDSPHNDSSTTIAAFATADGQLDPARGFRLLPPALTDPEYSLTTTAQLGHTPVLVTSDVPSNRGLLLGLTDTPSEPDTTPPPAPRLLAATKLRRRGAAPGGIVVRWTAIDAGLGIGYSELRGRYDGRGRWREVTPSGLFFGGSSSYVYPTTEFTGRLGRSACFQTRTRDRAGNLSAWSDEHCWSLSTRQTPQLLRGFAPRQHARSRRSQIGQELFEKTL